MAVCIFQEVTSLCPAKMLSSAVGSGAEKLSFDVLVIDLRWEGHFNHSRHILFHLSRCTLILVLLRCLQTVNHDALRLMVNLRLTLCLL